MQVTKALFQQWDAASDIQRRLPIQQRLPQRAQMEQTMGECSCKLIEMVSLMIFWLPF